jgi:hypothetical protein
LELHFLNKKIDTNLIKKPKLVPVSYVINRIEGKYLKVKMNSKVIEKKVES